MRTSNFSFTSLAGVDSFELNPVTSQKSFYGKAIVYCFADGSRLLRSYDTPVAYMAADGTISRLWGGWSATTGKHVASFCGLNKKGFMALPLTEEF